jgi:sugar phosphate isomerase/epimerase
MFFVNLNLRSVYKDPGLLEAFLAKGLNPELGLDPVLMDMTDLNWHVRMAERLGREGLSCSLHLPFFDLQPGSADALVLEATRRRLSLAMEVARIYAPSHLVGHARYDHLLYMHSHQSWLARAGATWRAALAGWPNHPPLYLENTFEPDPRSVATVAGELCRQEDGPVGLCLDLGHWYSFAGGKDKDNLDSWLEAFGGKLGLLHLHDNDGSFDHHLGLGQGRIPWAEVFAGLAKRDLRPRVTFEPHGEEALSATLAFVAEHRDWFAPLGVTV